MHATGFGAHILRHEAQWGFLLHAASGVRENGGRSAKDTSTAMPDHLSHFRAKGKETEYASMEGSENLHSGGDSGIDFFHDLAQRLPQVMICRLARMRCNNLPARLGRKGLLELGRHPAVLAASGSDGHGRLVVRPLAIDSSRGQFPADIFIRELGKLIC